MAERRRGDVADRRERVADPLRGPVGLLEKAHRPGGRRAPCGRSTALVPDTDFPEELPAAGERSTLILDLVLVAARGLAGVPEVGVVRREVGGGARHLDLIRALADAACGAGVDDPAQAGDAGVERERIDEVFGAEGDRADGARSSRLVFAGQRQCRAQQDGVKYPHVRYAVAFISRAFRSSWVIVGSESQAALSTPSVPGISHEIGR